MPRREGSDADDLVLPGAGCGRLRRQRLVELFNRVDVGSDRSLDRDRKHGAGV
jgi:hypothetical protein